MPAVTVRRLLNHEWTYLFALVQDVQHYPRFVPGCRHVRLLTQKDLTAERTEIMSRMTVGMLPLQFSYTNRTIADRGTRRITVDSTDGPLSFLHVLWRFEPGGERRTQIAFTAGYEFRNPVVARLAAGALEGLFSPIVDAFAHRADALRKD